MSNKKEKSKAVSLADRIEAALLQTYGKGKTRARSKGAEQRKRARQLLTVSLKTKGAREFVANLEQCLYDNLFVFHPTKYVRRTRTLARHLIKDPQRFMTIEPSLLATMGAGELCGFDPKSVPFDREVKQQVDIYGGKSEHPCRKCKSINTDYTTTQNKAGDEGFTNKFYCSDCGHRWSDS